ncbi:unnamed protein product, partial [Schistosoma turkestanicum]
MCSAVDRTSDFIRSVQLNRSKLNDLKRQDDLSSNSLGNQFTDHTSLGLSKANSNDPVNENTIPSKSNVPNGLIKSQDYSLDKKKSTTLLSQRSQFMKAASMISQDLTNTFSKLEQLNALARKQTLFDDHSAEMQHLTYVIKESIANLNNRIANLQEISKSQLSNGKQQSTHSRSVLMVLQTHLAKMSNQFRGVLEYRSENLRVQNARKSKYSSLNDMYKSSETLSTSSSSTSGKPPLPHVVIPSVLLKDDERAREALLSEKQGNDGLDGLGSLGSSSIPMNSNLGLAQKYINPDQTDSYLLSRSETMQSIEHTVIELGQIFPTISYYG